MAPPCNVFSASNWTDMVQSNFQKASGWKGGAIPLSGSESYSLRLQRRLAWTQTAFCEHSASTTKARVRHDTRWIRCRGWFSYCHPPEVERRLESANA